MRWRRSALGLLSLLAGLLLASAPASADFPVVAAKAISTNVGTTTHTVNLPSGIASGHLLVCGLATDGTPTTTWPPGWTALVGDTNHGTVFSARIYYRVADGTEGASITVTTPITERSSAICLRITGQQASTTPEAATPATGQDTAPDPPSLTPSGWNAANEDTLWLAFGFSDNGTTDYLTYPTNYLDGTNINDQTTAGTSTAYAYRQHRASGEDPGAFSQDASDQWIATTLAIRPAVAGGGGGGASFPTVAGVAASSTSPANTSHTINLPSGIGVGDRILCGMVTNATPTTTWPSGWTQLVGDTGVDGVMSFRLRYRDADGSEGASINVTTDTSQAAAATCYLIRGHATTAPEAQIALSSSGTSPNPPSLTPSWGADKTLWFVWAFLDLAGTTCSTFPTNYTTNAREDDSGSAGGGSVCSSHREAEVATEDPDAFGLSADDQTGVVTVGIKPLVTAAAAGFGRLVPVLFRRGGM